MAAASALGLPIRGLAHRLCPCRVLGRVSRGETGGEGGGAPRERRAIGTAERRAFGDTVSTPRFTKRAAANFARCWKREHSAPVAAAVGTAPCEGIAAERIRLTVVGHHPRSGIATTPMNVNRRAGWGGNRGTSLGYSGVAKKRPEIRAYSAVLVVSRVGLEPTTS